MTYDCSRITERLYVGSRITDASNVADIKALGITHVIDANIDGEEPLFPPTNGIALLVDTTKDDGTHKGASWFMSAIDFGIGALSFKGNIVLTHCAEGRNRGPSLGYAIMRAQGFTAVEAMNLLETRPVCVGGVRYAGDAELALVELGWVKQTSKLVGFA
jgi:protein tyrosine phosphatase (PTP) superfamily phosphohydrolase (DUF442 family)